MNGLSLKLFATNEENLLNIWENFTDLVIDDKDDPKNQDIKQFFENTILELASGNEVVLNGITPSVEQLFTTFFKSFNVDEDKYYFRYKNIIAEGFVNG